MNQYENVVAQGFGDAGIRRPLWRVVEYPWESPEFRFGVENWTGMTWIRLSLKATEKEALEDCALRRAGPRVIEEF